jgi:hypothetical protein
MFKPVRIVATVVVLAMIAMIFISAFVLSNGTLCISKFLALFSPPLLALCSSEGYSFRRTRVPCIPLVHVIIHSLCAGGRSQSVETWMMLVPRSHLAYRPLLFGARLGR